MDDETFPIVPLLVSLFVVFLMGVLIGSNTPSNTIKEDTTIKCIEQPKDCKIQYDYYKLKK